MSKRTALLILLSGLGTAAFAASSELLVLRVHAPASLLQADSGSALMPQQIIAAGDVVSTGDNGRVALQLAGQGQLVLSSFTDLKVYEVSPALSKLALLSGALRVDGRATSGKSTQDVRLNVGALKTRLLGADAWAARTLEGDTLCLLTGKVHVQIEGAEEQQLNTASSCLRLDPEGRITRFSIDADPLIAGAIAATALETAARAVVQAAPVAAPAPQAAAPIARATIAAAADAAAEGGWTFVVLSNPKPEPITARVEALVAQGLSASSRTAVVNGKTVYRASIGRFATHAQANTYASRTLTPLGIKGWAAPL